MSFPSAYGFHLWRKHGWRRLNAWMNSFPVSYFLPMKGGWVIDCAVRVTGVSMTQAASEPWGNFTPNSSVRDRSYSRVHDICQIPICLDLSSSTVRIGLLCTWCIWGLQWNRHLSCTDQTQAADVAGHVVHMNHRRHHWSRETCLRQRVKSGTRALNLERQAGIIHSFKVVENPDPNTLAVFILPAILYK